MLDVPPTHHPAWARLIRGTSKFNLDFLPLKIFLIRAELTIQQTPTDAVVQGLIQEARLLLVKNIQHPATQKDIAKIFGGRS